MPLGKKTTWSQLRVGLLAIFGPVQVKRRATQCIDCKKCEHTCPASIRITQAETVRHAECIGCMECVDICPQENCLSLEIPPKRHMSIGVMPIAVIGIFGLFYIAALITGHWHTTIPLEMMKQLYQSASTFTHP